MGIDSISDILISDNILMIFEQEVTKSVFFFKFSNWHVKSPATYIYMKIVGFRSKKDLAI